MLRPQVFALSDTGEVQIGLICSEKQAIDATLRSLAEEDKRFSPVADRYWNARGGSSTDGGAFIFTVAPGDNGDSGQMRLSCTDKFGREVKVDGGCVRCDLPESAIADASGAACAADTLSAEEVQEKLRAGDVDGLFAQARQLAIVAGRPAAPVLQRGAGRGGRPQGHRRPPSSCSRSSTTGASRPATSPGRRWSRSSRRRSISCSTPLRSSASPPTGSGAASTGPRATWSPARRPGKKLLCIDAEGFPPEGDDCDAVLLRKAYQAGWKRFIVYRLRGQRFHGVGLGAATDGVRIDLYGSNGDYPASGMDGLEMHIHGNAQDQVAQIAKRGKLVIYGDVGQTFMYGAKGGEVFIMGNGAGRPLINAVGRPRVVINGTCLDFLAESFMAGDPLNGGGFVILNGVEFDADGGIVPQASPYPGSNLFSLASGGAIYLRDPHKKVVESQLNGGVFSSIGDKDWRLIRGYLEENERLFGIRVEDLLTVDGEVRAPHDVYRKVSAVKLSVLSGSEEKK